MFCIFRLLFLIAGSSDFSALSVPVSNIIFFQPFCLRLHAFSGKHGKGRMQLFLVKESGTECGNKSIMAVKCTIYLYLQTKKPPGTLGGLQISGLRCQDQMSGEVIANKTCHLNPPIIFIGKFFKKAARDVGRPSF